MNLLIRLAATLAVAACCIGSAQAAQYRVTVDTSVLAAAATPPAPFALDFQLNGGSPAGNTAVINSFSFGSGSAVGSATTFGAASGSLAGSVTLSSAGSFFNEFYQAFTAGSVLSFIVDLSTTVNLPTPDAFAFAILDANLANISTSDLAADTLVRIDIDASVPVVQSYVGIGSYAGITTSVVAVPEPATFALAGLGLALVGLTTARRRHSA